jgi:hypothetical protein
MRAGRTRGEGLKKALETEPIQESDNRGWDDLILPALMPPPPVPLPDVPTGVGLGLGVTKVANKSTPEDLFKGIVVIKTARVFKVEVMDGRGGMTLDEFVILGGNKENVFPTMPSRRGVPAISSKSREEEEDPLAPSLDISTILSCTPVRVFPNHPIRKFPSLPSRFRKRRRRRLHLLAPVFVRLVSCGNGSVARRRLIIPIRNDARAMGLYPINPYNRPS